MIRCPSLLRNLMPLARMLLMFLMDAWRFLLLCLRPRPALAAENRFLRQQLALYQERQITPRRPTQATRMVLAWLARWFDWRHALVLVQPPTLIRWHRQGFRLFWQSMTVGDMHSVQLPTANGHEQGGRRPAIILQHDQYAGRLPVVLVVPLTTARAAIRVAGTTLIRPTTENG
jgi:hypothetical protein